MKSKPSLISLSIQLYGALWIYWLVVSILRNGSYRSQTTESRPVPRLWNHYYGMYVPKWKGVRGWTTNQVPRILKEGNPKTRYVSMTGKVLLTDARTTPDVSVLPHLKDMSSDSWRSIHCRPWWNSNHLDDIRYNPISSEARERGRTIDNPGRITISRLIVRAVREKTFPMRFPSKLRSSTQDTQRVVYPSLSQSTVCLFLRKQQQAICRYHGSGWVRWSKSGNKRCVEVPVGWINWIHEAMV